MARQDILNEVEQGFGLVPDFLNEASDEVLAQWWSAMGWGMSDTALSVRDKVLVSFGAAVAIHCEY